MIIYILEYKDRYEDPWYNLWAFKNKKDAEAEKETRLKNDYKEEGENYLEYCISELELS